MSFAELYDACWQAVSTRLDRISGQSIAVPPRLPVGNATAGARTADRFAVLDWLDAALELAGRHPLHELAHGLTALSEDLIWTQNAGYSAANTTASFLDGYAYAPIAGPGAPVPVCSLLSPFLFQNLLQHLGKLSPSQSVRMRYRRILLFLIFTKKTFPLLWKSCHCFFSLTQRSGSKSASQVSCRHEKYK